MVKDLLLWVSTNPKKVGFVLIFSGVARELEFGRDTIAKIKSGTKLKVHRLVNFSFIRVTDKMSNFKPWIVNCLILYIYSAKVVFVCLFVCLSEKIGPMGFKPHRSPRGPPEVPPRSP